jgi:Flp pilus assembly protein TadD
LKVLKLDPRDYRSLVNLAVIADRTGDKDASLSYLKEASKLKNGQGRKIYNNMSIMKLKQNNIKESQQLIDQAYQMSSAKISGDAHGHEIILINRIQIA